MADTKKRSEVSDINRSIYDIKDEVSYSYKADTGLTEEIIREISAKKEEPEWMLKKRLQALKIYNELDIPPWMPDISELDMGHIDTYVRPKTDMKARWEDLPENIRDTLHAYQMAKRCNVKRVMSEAVKWGERGARINSISPGIIVTPLAIDEFNGPRGDFYKNMFAKCPAGRPGTADEVAHVAELLLDDKAAFITGSDFLIDGGATASYFYGPLQPGKNG